MDTITERIQILDKQTSFVKYTTPINLDEEYNKFFASQCTYSPQLQYVTIPQEKFTTFEDELKNIDLSSIKNEYRLIYRNKIIELQNKISILKKRDQENFLTLTLTFFNINFNQEYIEVAEQTSSSDLKLPAKENFSIAELEKEFQTQLTANNIRDWKIVHSKKIGFNIRLNFNKKIVIISNKFNAEFLSLKALVTHEVIHIIRYENSTFLQDPIFIIGTAGYLKIEEGVACYMEDGLSAGSQYQHAVEYLASNRSRHDSFIQVFSYLRHKGFSNELAWQRGIRMKYGMCNTKNSGVNGKVPMYFEGLQLVRNFYKTNNSINAILKGRISLEDIA